MFRKNDAKGGRNGWVRRFFRRDSGTASVEAVIWLPVFIIFFKLLVDATMIMFGQAQALRVVQDLNRGISLGMIQNEAQIDSFVARHLPRYSSVAVVNSSVSQGVVSTRMTIPSSNIVAANTFSLLPSFDINVSAQHLVEN